MFRCKCYRGPPQATPRHSPQHSKPAHYGNLLNGFVAKYLTVKPTRQTALDWTVLDCTGLHSVSVDRRLYTVYVICNDGSSNEPDA